MGVAKQLSTFKIILCFFAMALTMAISITSNPGFVGVSK